MKLVEESKVCYLILQEKEEIASARKLLDVSGGLEAHTMRFRGGAETPETYRTADMTYEQAVSAYRRISQIR